MGGLFHLLSFSRASTDLASRTNWDNNNRHQSTTISLCACPVVARGFRSQLTLYYSNTITVRSHQGALLHTKEPTISIRSTRNCIPRCCCSMCTICLCRNTGFDRQGFLFERRCIALHPVSYASTWPSTVSNLLARSQSQ